MYIGVANPVLAVTCADLDGSSVVSDEVTPVYLGFFGHSLAADSLNNSFGTYGSQFSSLSVRNPFGSYGGEFAIFSANNDFSLSLPFIIKRGEIVARLTTNTFIADNVSLSAIDASCGNTFLSFSPVPQYPDATLVIATDGALEGRIFITWSSALGADFYEIIRATQSSMNDAIILESVNSLT